MESSPLPSSSPSSIPAFPPPPKKRKRLSAVMIVTFLLAGLLAGGLIGYSITYSDFNQKLSNLQSQIGLSQSSGDIITAINGARITNTDDLLSYLEQHTLPGQTVNFTVVRTGQIQTIQITIGKA
jgi:S1-C subfamily serine protease